MIRPFPHRALALFLATLSSVFCSTATPVWGDQVTEALHSFADKVEMRTLSNGLRVIAVQRGEAPVFGGAVIVRVGGSDELPGHTGIAHMFEHMAFKGSPRIGTKDYVREQGLLKELEVIAQRSQGATKLTDTDKSRWDELNTELKTIWDSDAFTQEYDKRGAVGLNATTSAELTSYFVGLPANSFEFWASMEAERLISPVMRQFYQERDVVMEERRMRTDNSGDGRLYEQLLQTAFTKHPYRNPVIGYPADISRITASDTEAFRQRFYVPENIAVAVVGNISPSVVFKTAERYFGKLPAARVQRNEIPMEPKQNTDRHLTVKYPSEPNSFVAFHKPAYPDRDAIALLVASEILAGGSPTSLLHRRLVEQEEILTSIAAFEVPGVAYPNLILFEVTPKSPHTTTEGVTALRRALKAVTLAEVERLFEPTRKGIVVGELAKLQSNVGLAKELASTEVLYGTWKAGLDQLEVLQSLTAKDVFAAIQTYLVNAHATIGNLERSHNISAVAQ